MDTENKTNIEGCEKDASRALDDTQATPAEVRKDWCIEVKGAFENSRKRMIAFGGLTEDEAHRLSSQGESINDAAKERTGHHLSATKTPARCDVCRVHEDDDGNLIVENSEQKGLDWQAAHELADADPSLRVVRNTTNRKLTAAACAIVIVALAGVGTAFALGQHADTIPSPAQQARPVAQAEAPAEKATEKSEVSLILKAEGADAAITKAKVKVTKEGKDTIAEREIACNEAVSLGELDAGDYELVVTTVPVLEDGSTYELPQAPVKFNVDGKGKPVKMDCELAKLSTEEMDEEQLEAAAGALDAVGKADAATGLREAAKTAPSTGASSKNESPKDSGSSSPNGSTPAPSKPSGGSSNSSSGGGVSEPAKPQHAHNWEPVHGKGDPIYSNGDPIYGNGDPIFESHYYCSICGEIPRESYVGHKKPHALAGESASTWTEDVVTGYKQIITGYKQVITGYQEVVTGYKCSCGATK